MSQNEFSSLMKQYGGAAEKKKLGKYRASRRSQTFQKIRRPCLLLVLLAAVIVCLTTKPGASSYATAEGNTQLRLADIQNEAERRIQAIEAAYK
jgi:hypothetical protein